MRTEEMLHSIPVFGDIPRSRLPEVAMLTDQISVPTGKVLAREGELAHEFFVIVEGVVAVIRDGSVVEILGEGDFFGELALLGDPHRTATVVAASDVHLIVVARREFRTMLARFPDFASSVLSAATRRVVANLRAAEAA